MSLRRSTCIRESWRFIRYIPLGEKIELRLAPDFTGQKEMEEASAGVKNGRCIKVQRIFDVRSQECGIAKTRNRGRDCRDDGR
jgi:hypothetical protein